MTIMLTHCGHRVDLSQPWRELMNLSDIAVSLSRIARFLGHTGGAGPLGDARFLETHGGIWSVGQHSLYVAELIGLLMPGDPVARAYALLHDAHEAYLGDLSRPVKDLMQAAGFDFNAAIAAPIQAAIHEAHGLPVTLPAAIREAVELCDQAAAWVELHLFMGDSSARRRLPPGRAWPQPSALLRKASPAVVAEAFFDEAATAIVAARDCMPPDAAPASAPVSPSLVAAARESGA
jgi:hypothetical protein